MPVKKGRGRPAKPKAQKQDARLLVYMTAKEARMLRADAGRREQTPSMFLADLWRQWREAREN